MIRIKFIFIFILSLGFVFSCSPKEATGFGPSDKSSNPTPQNDGATPPADYSLNDFFVTLDATTAYPFYVSKSGQFNSKCSVSKDSVTHQNLDCIIDVPELALFFNGAKLAVNVPTGMCEYMMETPYWYYNYETGYGATSVAVEITSRENIDVKTYRCSVNGSPLSSSCFGYDEVFFTASSDGSIGEKCAYDWTDSYGQNCCLGNYSLTTTNISINASGVATSQTVQEPSKSWGGNIKGCIGGAGKTDWEHYSKSGFPSSLIHETRAGVLKPFEISAPISSLSGYPSNITIANYYSATSPATSSLHYHKGYGSASGTSSTKPYFIDPVSDRGGTRMTSGNASYEYRCLDNAQEVKHSIRVYIREWDTYAAFSSYLTTGVAVGTPWDVSGTEGVDCEGSGDSESCNDQLDSDDLVRDLTGGVYDTTDLDARQLYFPSVAY